jgi:hypothetical protein
LQPAPTSLSPVQKSTIINHQSEMKPTTPPTPPAPDFAKIREAAARIDMRGMTTAARELIAMGRTPIHIRPAPVHMKLPPVDAARRKHTASINPAAARSSFLNLSTNLSR